jgi:hypothetical protein
MALRQGCRIGIAAGIAAAAVALICGVHAASAQEDTLKPIPVDECQKFAARLQESVGIPMKAEEDDFSDINTREDGRSCHITGSASNKTFANPDDVMALMAKPFGDWKEDEERADSGPGGADKGFLNGNRLAVLDVSWEPAPGVTCSDKEPLSECKVTPQQRLWTAIIDIVQKVK